MSSLFARPSSLFSLLRTQMEKKKQDYSKQIHVHRQLCVQYGVNVCMHVCVLYDIKLDTVFSLWCESFSLMLTFTVIVKIGRSYISSMWWGHEGSVLRIGLIHLLHKLVQYNSRRHLLLSLLFLTAIFLCDLRPRQANRQLF